MAQSAVAAAQARNAAINKAKGVVSTSKNKWYLDEATKLEGNTGITEWVNQDVSPVAWITDKMKNTDVYKNLLNKWYTEQQIGDSFANKSDIKKLTPAGTVTPPTIDTPKNGTTTGVNKTTPTATTWVDQNLDYNTSNIGRLWEITKHLNDAYVSNPEKFTTYDKFKIDYNYNGRSSDQKKVLDSFFNSKIWPKFDTFWNMTESQISDAYMGGTLTDGDLLNLKAIDPAKRQLAQTAISNAKTYGDANNSIANKIKDVQKQLGITPPEDIDLVDKFNEFVNTEEVKTLGSSLSEKQGKIDILDQQMADMDKTIADQYSGTGMTQDVIDAISADKKEALSRERARLAIGYNTELNKYNAIYKAGTDQFQAYKDQITQDRQERTDTMAQLWFYYESTPAGMAEVAKAQETLTPIEIQTKDFGTAKKPDWKQSLDGGKTRQSISGISWGGTATGSTWWWISSWLSGWLSSTWNAAQTEAWLTLDNLASSTLNERRWAMLWKVSWILSTKMTKMQADYAWIQKQLMFKDFIQYKKEWATFGAMSEAERAAIQAAASKLQWGMSDADWNHEIWVIRQKLWAVAARNAKWWIVDTASYSSSSNNKKTTPTPNSQFWLSYSDMFNIN